MGMAERIKERRIAIGITQEELAKKLGLQKSAIAKYENGRVKNIKRTVIFNMANILDCNPSYLMGWDEIDKEINSIKNRTKLYIEVFESHGYNIYLKKDTVEITDTKKKIYSIPIKEFMSTVQRCYKDIEWNIEKMINEYASSTKDIHHVEKQDSDIPILNAAHEIPDATNEEKQHDEDIMDDENF